MGRNGHSSIEETGFEFGLGGFLADKGERARWAEKTKMNKSLETRVQGFWRPQ